jgi:GT2 family glycosyltransferase
MHINIESFKIIVVDNASLDGSVQMVKSEFPEAVVIENDKNLGYGAAINRAIPYAKGEYFVFMNPDTEITYDLFSPLMQYLSENDDVGAAGCRLVFPDGRAQRNFFRFPSLIGRIAYFTGINKILNAETLRKDESEKSDSSVKSVDTICGAFTMIKLELFRSLNGFDENFFLYHEEADLCYRIGEKGLRRIVHNGHSIIHYGSHSESAENETVFYHRNRSLLIYFLKHHSRLSLWFLILMNIVGMSAKLISQLLLSGNSESRTAKRKSYIAVLKYHVKFVHFLLSSKETQFPE